MKKRSSNIFSRKNGAFHALNRYFIPWGGGERGEMRRRRVGKLRKNDWLEIRGRGEGEVGKKQGGRVWEMRGG